MKRLLWPFYLLGIVGTFVLTLSLWLATYLWPAEDAMILFRYAKNLADTGIIGYHATSGPVEGSTDFLWMVGIAALHKLGLSPYQASLGLSFLGWLGMHWLLFRVLGRKLAPFWWGSLALMLAPQWWAAVQGFSVYVYGAAILWAMVAYWEGQARELAVASLLSCLVRPDAIVVVLPLIGFFLFQRRKAKDLSVWPFGGFFLLPGTLYFAWRWQYFGHFLPLPFYVKGFQPKVGGVIQLASVAYLAIYLLRYLGPLLAGMIPLLQKGSAKVHGLWISGLLSPLLFYAQVSLEQNVAHRFVFPLFICVLLAFFLKWDHIKYAKWLIVIYLVLSTAYSLAYFARSLPLHHNQMPRLGKALSPYPGILATTEAGRLPYYSEWETIDLWGLNTPALARQLPDSAYLTEVKPDLIYLDDGDKDMCTLSQQLGQPYRRQKTWDGMVFNSLKYAYESQSYEAWLIPFQTQPKAYLKLESFLYSIFPNQPANRTDLILVNHTFPFAAEVEQVLRTYGGERISLPCEATP